MRVFQRIQFWIVTTLVCLVGYAVGCVKSDQVVLPSSSSANLTTLVSLKTATAPTIDGTVEAIWGKATKLNFTPTVPDPGNGLFTG